MEMSQASFDDVIGCDFVVDSQSIFLQNNVLRVAMEPLRLPV
jgi:hypothetical protein